MLMMQKMQFEVMMDMKLIVIICDFNFRGGSQREKTQKPSAKCEER